MAELITIVEYAKIHGKEKSSVRYMCARGSLKTARKIGRDWLIDPNELYPDRRIKSGKYINWRKKKDEE